MPDPTRPSRESAARFTPVAEPLERRILFSAISFQPVYYDTGPSPTSIAAARRPTSVAENLTSSRPTAQMAAALSSSRTPAAARWPRRLPFRALKFRRLLPSETSTETANSTSSRWACRSGCSSAGSEAMW
jgi:hypothetical protein